MKQKVVIAGGSGFIGQYLKERFEEDGATVLIISRAGSGMVAWDDPEGIRAGLEGSAILINLAGKPINCKFSPENQKALIDSRISCTETLANAIMQCQQAPLIWFNASGAHIYGTSDHILHTEEDPIDKTFFLAQMAKAWEDAFFSTTPPNTRQVALRFSIVIGKEGGVLQPYIMLTKFLLGGKQGTGKQIFSWIHVADIYQIILFAAAHESISGALNISSPEPVSNKDFMQTLRSTMKVPFGFPAPEWGIKIGAALMGIESDLILKSLSVYPKHLLESGYQFQFPTLKSALENIISAK